MPSSAATVSATDGASPVIITTWMPTACSAATVSRDSGRISSATLSAPATCRSTSTCSTVAPSASHSARCGRGIRPCWASRYGPPTSTTLPSTVAFTPTAGADEKSVTIGTGSCRDWAAARMAFANGCSENDSAAAASASTSSSLCPSLVCRPVTAGSPLVRVPVLSKSTVSTVRIDSSASRSLIRTPPLAARSVAIETTNGIARPSACGQAMTSTVMARTTAWSGLPISVQTVAVIAAAPRASQNSQPAARSARRWARDEDACASATKRWMPARVVSSPIAVTSTRRPESVATVPATTWSPSSRRTARDSPVTIDSSMLAEPAVIRPSAGIAAPGRTMTTSPICRSAGATFTICSPSTRSASSGSSAAKESSAEVVWASERISIQCPSNMITTSSASSHQKFSTCESRPRLAPRDAPNATVIASAISSIMPGLRCLSSSRAPARNGRPPQR